MVHSEPLEINFSAWFEPYIRRWLATTDTQTSKWVNRAIAKDQVCHGVECHDE